MGLEIRTMNDSSTYLDSLLEEIEVPGDGILSRVILKNSAVNVTLFGFSAGQELSEHTAATPAIIQILRGEAKLTIGGEEKNAGPGAWLYMPARVPHSLVAETPVVMLLLLLK